MANWPAELPQMITQMAKNAPGPIEYESRIRVALELRLQREALGLSQADVAEALRLSRPSVINYEAGRTALRLDQLPPLQELGFDPLRLVCASLQTDPDLHPVELETDS